MIKLLIIGIILSIIWYCLDIKLTVKFEIRKLNFDMTAWIGQK